MHGETIDRASTPARTSAASSRAVAGVMVALVSASIAPFLVGALSVQIGATFPFSTSDVALGVAGYYLVSAVVSPLGGRVVDALGPARALRLAGVGSTAGLVLIAIADTASAVVAALALLGLPNSLVQPASNQVLAAAPTARRQGLTFGLVQSAIPVATLLSGVLLGTVGDDSSWRGALWLVVLLSLAGQLVLAGRLPSSAPADAGDPQTRGERLVGGPLLMGALVLGGLLGSMAAMTLTAFAAATGQHAGFGSQAVAFAQVVGSLLCVVVRVAATWRGSELAGPQLLFLIVSLLALGSGGYVLVGSATALTFTLGVALAYGCGWGWTALFNLSLTRVRPSRIAASTGLTQQRSRTSMNPVTQDEGVLDLMVESMTVEAGGVLSLTLVDPDGGWLPEWTPGAHIDLGMPDVIRQYSLCGDPRDRSRYVVAVLMEAVSRGGSEYVHHAMRPGEPVEVGGPRNHFPLSPAKEYVFIAGGIGITPILAMIGQAEREQIPWRLLYGGRSRSSMAFLAQLEQYGDRVLVCPEDEVGRPDLDGALAEHREGLAVYCCGPGGLIDAVESRCAAWPEDAVNFERFVAKDLSALPSIPFTVTCARSQLTLDVPAGEGLLDVLEAAGIGVANACRDGVCGSCEVPVLAGVPDHRDSIRSGDALHDTSSLAVCVSRAKTPELVLDI